MSTQITCFADVFGLWIKPRLMAAAMQRHTKLPVEPSRVRNWKARSRIPADYLKAAALAARDEGYEVSYDQLKEIYTKAEQAAAAAHSAAEFS